MKKLFLLAFALGLALSGAAQVYQPNFYSNVLTNGVLTVAAVTATDVSAITKPITVRQGKGIAFLPLVVGTNTATANAVFKFNVTADGTNYTTTFPIQGTVALNGTTPARGYILIPNTSLDNVRAIRLDSITNAHTASIIITNVVASYSNQ